MLKINIFLTQKFRQIHFKVQIQLRSNFKNVQKFIISQIIEVITSPEILTINKVNHIKRSKCHLSKFVISKDLLDQQQLKKNKKQSLLNKFYDPIKIQKESQQKIGNCFFIKVPKIFMIYRRPISPFITQKCDDCLVFSLSRSNSKQKLLRFLRIYDQLIKTNDEQKLVKNIIAAAQQQSAQQLLQTYQNQKLQAASIIRCKRVTIQGTYYGNLVLLKTRAIFIPVVNCPQPQQIQFNYSQIKHLMRYRYLFQQIGIQTWIYNKQFSLLLIFNDQTARQGVYRIFRQRGQKMIKIDRTAITNAWINGQINNGHYLNIINILAGRSFNDLSQYPIFPWIIQNYQGEFNLKNIENFRDLSKPIGAINKHRLRKLKDLAQLQLKNQTHPPHIYPTHYSTPGYTTYFLIRKIPQFIVKIQYGVFSPPQRIFRSIQSAYYSTMNSFADFKQLIPQFYGTQCDFLVNSQKLEMGSTPDGQQVDDVVLPNWAKSAQDFLFKMRAALECDFVSAHINEWIDLIFGCKQNGPSAAAVENVYYHLTYQQNVNFDRPLSRLQRNAMQTQAAQFGQIPIQIFQDKHPIRKVRLLNIQLGDPSEDKKILSVKMQALVQQNQRLQQDLQRQRNRFTRKLQQRQQLLLKSNLQKKKQIQKMKQLLNIDARSLKSFGFKQKFRHEEDKDVYIRQLQELLRQQLTQNQEMQVIVAGLKRQMPSQNKSVNSSINENADLEADFFEDPKLQ